MSTMGMWASHAARRTALQNRRRFLSSHDQMNIAMREAALASFGSDTQDALPREFLDLVRTAERKPLGVAHVAGEESVLDVDPFELVKPDLASIDGSIKDLLGSDHPVLHRVAQYFFNVEGGKKVRPTMVLLVARACNTHTAVRSGLLGTSIQESSTPTSRQRRLAEITEMIHVASLLHDDVIDSADSRRGVGSVNEVFGNKLAVLAGDFLLARSSVCTARLRNLDVVEILGMVLEDLVKGEVYQMRNIVQGDSRSAVFDSYLRKNFYKTGSLMANSCRASAVLNDHTPEEVREAVYVYGRGVGAAFQLVDDILDFEGKGDELGKPTLSDLGTGLATAPILFAAEEHQELEDLIARKFSTPGDIEYAQQLLNSSHGIVRTKNLAIQYSNQAVEAILTLEPSPARDGLVRLARNLIERCF